MADSQTDTEDEVEDAEPMSDKDKQKRISELEAELNDLRGDGPLEDATDADVKEVAADIENAAEDIAESPDVDVTEDSKDAADEIAKDLDSKGITLSETEIDGLADRIAKKVAELMSKGPEQTVKRSAPRRDQSPKPTHFLERTVGRRKG